MSRFLRDILSDQKGKYSSFRVFGSLCILTGVFLTLFWALQFKEIDHVIVIELLGAGFGGKWFGKQQETKQLSNPPHP